MVDSLCLEQKTNFNQYFFIRIKGYERFHLCAIFSLNF